MRLWLPVLACLAGCSFQPSGGAGASGDAPIGPAIDAPRPPDADGDGGTVDAAPGIDARAADARMADAPGDSPLMADARQVRIVVTGQTFTPTGSSGMPVVGAAVTAFATSDPNTPVASTMTDSNGNFSLTITLVGATFDGYFHATAPTLVDSNLYPSAPLSASTSGVPIIMLPAQFLTAFATQCGVAQLAGAGTIGLQVTDAGFNPIDGAVVGSAPAAGKTCYDNGMQVSPTATATAGDGFAYLFNATGPVMLSATKTGDTFHAHTVTAVANTFTTTFVTE